MLGLLCLCIHARCSSPPQCSTFFPIEGAEKSFREVHQFYARFGHADRIAMAEGYHGHEYSDANQEAAFEFMDHFNRLPATRGLAAAGP